MEKEVASGWTVESATYLRVCLKFYLILLIQLYACLVVTGGMHMCFVREVCISKDDVLARRDAPIRRVYISARRLFLSTRTNCDLGGFRNHL